MQIEEYLKQYQPLCYRVFSSSLQDGRLNHAYLLAGEQGIPLKEIALYLAKSILCDHPSPLADDTCLTCHRVDAGTYTDLIVLDGESDSIKKSEIIDIADSFSKTSMEDKGVMIYIIHLAERTTSEAINSLLKFLEEPTPNTYAILTTQNQARILPTILSRCEIIRLNPVPRKDVLSRCAAMEIPSNKAELLSFFYNSGELIASKLEEESTEELFSLFDTLIATLSEDKARSIFLFESKLIPLCSNKAKAATLIELLIILYRELLNLKNGFELTLPSYTKKLKPLAEQDERILRKNLDFLLTVKTELDWNINPSLLLDHIIITLAKEESK